LAQHVVTPRQYLRLYILIPKQPVSVRTSAASVTPLGGPEIPTEQPMGETRSDVRHDTLIIIIFSIYLSLHRPIIIVPKYTNLELQQCYSEHELNYVTMILILIALWNI